MSRLEREARERAPETAPTIATAAMRVTQRSSGYCAALDSSSRAGAAGRENIARRSHWLGSRRPRIPTGEATPRRLAAIDAFAFGGRYIEKRDGYLAQPVRAAREPMSGRGTGGAAAGLGQLRAEIPNQWLTCGTGEDAVASTGRVHHGV